MIRAFAFASAPLLFASAYAQQTPAPGPQPSPVLTPAPASTPNGTAGPVSAPTVSPAPSTVPSAAPTTSPNPPPPAPTPVYRFIYTPSPDATAAPADAPHIMEIDVTDQTIHQNSDVYLRVLTSPSVAVVVISAMGHDAPVPQVAPGVWSAGSHVPSVPFFMLNRTYNVQVRASASDGRSDSVTLPVRLVR